MWELGLKERERERANFLLTWVQRDSVADASHDDSEAEELGRRTTNKSHQDTHKTADDGTQHHIHRNEPPVPHVGQSHGLSQLREDETGEKQCKHQLDQQLGSLWGDDADSALR